MNTIYKVVKKVKHDPITGEVRRRRISCSVRHHLFVTEYPPGAWVSMRHGPSFVFVDEEAAITFKQHIDTKACPLELWIGESIDSPVRMLQMANAWRNLETFWRIKGHGGGPLSLNMVGVPCPETYHGVWNMRLVSRIG